MNFYLSLTLFLTLKLAKAQLQQEKSIKYEFDPNGYVIFCLCMGRFGNQADHFLGSMSFARALNRTLVVPPFLTYKNVPFREWFKLEQINKFHRSISAEDFMSQIAPKYWPVGKRLGFCWMQSERVTKNFDCEMMNGNPFRSFWSELGVKKFDGSVDYNHFYSEIEKWNLNFPASKYPIIALKGAPASFPVEKENRMNQKYLVWSDKIKNEVDNYIDKTFGSEMFIGIHLRNGPDWLNACDGVEGRREYMSSPQCLEGQGQFVTQELCYPSKKTILKNLENLLVKKLNKTIKNIYIATDKNPMINEIKSHFKGLIEDLNLVHNDPWLPVIDLAILARSDYFIGNCVSSFSSFAIRERDILKRPSYFWAFKKFKK